MRVAWVEPFGPNSEPMECRVTRATAIAVAKAVAAKRGLEYISDEDALEDFKVIHWAWEEE